MFFYYVLLYYYKRMVLPNEIRGKKYKCLSLARVIKRNLILFNFLLDTI